MGDVSAFQGRRKPDRKSASQEINDYIRRRLDELEGEEQPGIDLKEYEDLRSRYGKLAREMDSVERRPIFPQEAHSSYRRVQTLVFRRLMLIRLVANDIKAFMV